MSDQFLAGQRALIIGGSSGIGLAISEAFQAHGARIAVAARTGSKVTAAVERLNAAGKGDASGYTVDIAEDGERDRLFGEIERDHGGVDILVNSQGVTQLKPAEDFTEAEYDALNAINLRSVFFASTQYGRGMLARGNGSIINIASLAAHRGFQNSAIYTVTKHGVLGLTRAMAAEWAPRGVRVNAISPGFFMTELNQAKMSQARKDAALSRAPIGRFGKIEELKSAALFLANPASGYVTGTNIDVDGGYLAAGL